MIVLSPAEKKFANNIGCDVLVCGDQKGINLGLYYPEVWTKQGILKSNGVNVFFVEKNKVYVQNFNQVSILKKDLEPTHEEVLFHFCSWLTVRKEKITLSASDNPSKIVELLRQYCDKQGWKIHGDDFNYESLIGMNNGEEDSISETSIQGKFDFSTNTHPTN